jgi:predicted glycosyltransferase involved in capsule biosynthesis
MNKINEGTVKGFQKAVKYYLKSDGKMFQVMLNKKDLLALFGDKKILVESYAAAAGLSYKKESDVSKIIRYFDTIQ